MSSIRAWRYSAIFIPPVLLAVGFSMNFNLLLPAFFFVALPALRTVFGSVPVGRPREWTQCARTILAWLPRIYTGAFCITMAWILVLLWCHEPAALSGRCSFALALLVLCGLAECVAHDLGHRRQKWDRRAAHLISALAGYPSFIFEHWAHHAHARDVESAHCPRSSEGVWSYVSRRAWKAPRRALELNSTLADKGQSVLDDLRFYWVVCLGTFLTFASAGGWYGVLLYIVVLVGVPFLLNTITYIQHWGLGTDSAACPGGIRQVGWDETAAFQSWLILGISFHYQHHSDPSRPYYTYGPTEGAPKLPAEYAVLVPLCLVPPLWRRVMTPALQAWSSSQDD